VSARPVPAGVLAGVVLLVLAVVAGCATVPGSSDVTVLRRVGDAVEPSAPAGPARGAGPLETVRGWILASGSSSDRHEAARRFLTPTAAGGWDDGAAPVVVSDRVDTVYADRPVPVGESAVRIRATRLGTLAPDGSFVAQPGALDLVVGLAEQNGQWRISSVPAGTVVRRSDLRAATRPVRAWFLGATTGLPVGDTRYLPVSPARSVPGRTLDMVFGGPSASLAGAAVSALPPGATVRSAVAPVPDGATTVDLTRTGTLDPARREQVARQVVLTLAGVGVTRVRLLVDGAPLLPDRPEVTVGDVLAGLPARVLARRDLPVDPAAGPPSASTTPALVVTGGRVRALGDAPTPSAASTVTTARSAAAGLEGQDLAVVAARGAGEQLLVGRAAATLTPADVTGARLTRPTWTPSGGEVWTVVDGTRVVRLPRPPEAGPPPPPTTVDAGPLTAAGPITALRFSPDGVRVAAVAAGRVVVGLVVRDVSGGIRIASARVLRAGPGDEVLEGVDDVAWTQTDRIVAVGARVQEVSVDGLDLENAPTVNLTPPLWAVASAPGRPLLVVDQGGLWTLPDDGTGIWRSVPGGAPDAVPAYPG
jgi:hypothetical protein